MKSGITTNGTPQTLINVKQITINDDGHVTFEQ